MVLNEETYMPRVIDICNPFFDVAVLTNTSSIDLSNRVQLFCGDHSKFEKWKYTGLPFWGFRIRPQKRRTNPAFILRRCGGCIAQYKLSALDRCEGHVLLGVWVKFLKCVQPCFCHRSGRVRITQRAWEQSHECDSRVQDVLFCCAIRYGRSVKVEMGRR